VLIEAKELVNGVSIVQAHRVEEVEYFHIELDTHDVIIAEGALSETFIDDDSRDMFHNAQEFRKLYPDEGHAVARYCARRCDSGYEIELARQRIEQRAGLRREATEERKAIAMRGFVDQIGTRLIEGWAQDAEHSEAPVCLDIYADGRLIGQTLANRYREDLKRAGYGSGHHGFTFTLPSELAFSPGAVEVRRSLDDGVLALSLDAQGSLQRAPPRASRECAHRTAGSAAFANRRALTRSA